jgi:hypothetical protein
MVFIVLWHGQWAWSWVVLMNKLWAVTLTPGKRVQFDDESRQAIQVLARDRMTNIREFADEACFGENANHTRRSGAARSRNFLNPK